MREVGCMVRDIFLGLLRLPLQCASSLLLSHSIHTNIGSDKEAITFFRDITKVRVGGGKGECRSKRIGKMLEQGWRTFLRARSRIVYKFRRNPFVCVLQC
jgi:hypothetical protein